MVKVTFTLDKETIARLRRSAARLEKPQSQVVREAIRDYSDRIGKLSEQERLRLLGIFDVLIPKIPPRPLREVNAEIRSIRRARRSASRDRR